MTHMKFLQIAGCTFLLSFCLAVAQAPKLAIAQDQAAEPDLTGALSAEPLPPLTPFQWSLYSNGTLIMVPFEDAYYPAKRSDNTIIETLPERLQVELYFEEKQATPELRSVKAPHEFLPTEWYMEKWSDQSWHPVKSFHFDDMGFVQIDAPGQVSAPGLGEIRFRKRTM